MSEIATYERSFDMIIVGGGACGLSAAVEAGENGLNVVVIEKRHSAGGNAVFADGMLAAGSHIQKKQLLDVPPDEIVKFAMDYSHQSLNARLLRVFVDKTADNIRWLEDKGIKFHVDPYIPGQVYQTYHIPEGRMKQVMLTLKRQLVEMNVPVITDTEVTKIMKNEKGEVTGVLARDLEREFIVNAPNVLICTGGYSGNKEMLRKYFPFDSSGLICWGLHHNGDGIRMATEAGGANEGLGILCLSGPHIPATVKARIDIPGEAPCFIQVSALGREPTGVWVNKHGKRYVSEAIGLNGHEAPNAVIRQPDQTNFALFDSDTIQEMEDHGLIKGLNQDTRNKAIERSHLPGLAQQLRFQTEGMIYGEISDPDKCTGCGTCVMNCAAGAIKLDTIVEERNECSACRYACPLHTDMRTYNHLLKQGKKAEAYAVLREYNPLPAVTGRVCPHYCESECARQHVDESVNVRSLERFLADSYLDGEPAPFEKKHGERVAVIGSGPSGLACAYFLCRNGYEVTVFEKQPEAGGNLRYGIPSYRLPKDVLRKQIAYIEKMGVSFKCGVDVGRDVSFDEIRGEYDAVYFAIGAQLSAKIAIPGADSKNVLGGRDYLRDYENIKVEGDVVVVGGGSVAVDVALTALRRGAKSVRMVCLETGDQIPAWEEELEQARAEGVTLHEGWGPKAILTNGGAAEGIEFVKCTSVFDAEGRFAPVYDESCTESFKADMVIMAIGQAVDKASVPAELEAYGNGMLVVDKTTLRTNIDKVFSGGDIIGGRGSVVKSMAEGKEGAISIDRFLRGEDIAAGRGEPLRKVENPPKDNMPLLERSDVHMNISAGEELYGNFSEVRRGFNGQQAANEVNRCMTCGSRSVFAYSDDCQLCRACEENCPSKAITMKPLYKMERPLVKIADTWEEMAEYIGCSSEVLKKTVEEWNDYCDHGKDRMFVKREDYMRPLKKPPFYAVQSRVAFLSTIGGIKINEHFEVVDKNDEPIPGLYAGGIDCGGWESDTYNVVLSGSTMGFNISSGRLSVHEVMKRLGKE